MTLIVCFPFVKACWCCDTRRPHAGPSLGLDRWGIERFEPGDWIETAEGRVYCSIECHDDWEEFLATQGSWFQYCDECGYDSKEHNPATCSKATEVDRVREEAERLRLAAR